MNRLLILIGLIMAFAVTGCGSAKDYAGSAGSCAATGVCTDFSYSGKLSEDPGPTAIAEAKSSCTSQSGTYATTACSRTGGIATCVISGSAASGGETFTSTATMVFKSPSTTSSAQTACTAAGGTYTAL